MHIVDKKIQHYKEGSVIIRPMVINSERTYTINYRIETERGKITYRVSPFWTTLIRENGEISFLYKSIWMDENNPEDTINKFESLLILK